MITPVHKNSIVLFDLDDTLYNEIEFLKSAYCEIARFLHKDQWRALYAEMFSLYRGSNNVFEILSIKYNVSIEELLSLYRNHKPKIVPFNGVINLFDSIINKGAKIGIITDGRSVTQRNKIKSLSLDKYFDIVIISEEINSET